MSPSQVDALASLINGRFDAVEKLLDAKLETVVTRIDEQDALIEELTWTRKRILAALGTASTIGGGIVGLAGHFHLS